MTFQTYLAPNGFYCFVLYLLDGEEYCRDAGFVSQIEAEIAAREAAGTIHITPWQGKK